MHTVVFKMGYVVDFYVVLKCFRQSFLPLSPTIATRSIVLSSCQSVVCPLTPVSADAVSLLSGGILMKVASSIHHVSENC